MPWVWSRTGYCQLVCVCVLYHIPPDPPSGQSSCAYTTICYISPRNVSLSISPSCSSSFTSIYSSYPNPNQANVAHSPSLCLSGRRSHVSCLPSVMYCVVLRCYGRADALWVLDLHRGTGVRGAYLGCCARSLLSCHADPSSGSPS